MPARLPEGYALERPRAPVLSEPGSLPPALPPAQSHPACDPNCVDVTGKAPEGVRIEMKLPQRTLADEPLKVLLPLRVTSGA